MSKPKIFVYLSLVLIIACGETSLDTLPEAMNDGQGGQNPSTPLSQEGRLDLPPCDQLVSGDQSACQTSIYSLKDGNLIPDDSRVGIQGVVSVNRLNADGKYSHLVLETPMSDEQFAGPDFSAAWVYLNNADDETLRDNPPQVGTYVQIIGSVKTHFGQRQLQKVEQVIELSASVGVQAPIDVSASDVALNGPRSWQLEGSLIRVTNVEVTNASPVPGPGDGVDGAPTYEFEVSGGLIVNDFLYPGLPQPSNGQVFSEITGFLRYANNTFKLEPRGADDIY